MLIKFVVRCYKIIDEICNLIANIQVSVKQNKFVSGHFIWKSCNNDLAQNFIISSIPNGIFSIEAFYLVKVVKVFHCLFQFLKKLFPLYQYNLQYEKLKRELIPLQKVKC